MRTAPAASISYAASTCVSSSPISPPAPTLLPGALNRAVLAATSASWQNWSQAVLRSYWWDAKERGPQGGVTHSSSSLNCAYSLRISSSSCSARSNSSPFLFCSAYLRRSASACASRRAYSSYHDRLCTADTPLLTPTDGEEALDTEGAPPQLGAPPEELSISSIIPNH